jgi:hypothetical protein
MKDVQGQGVAAERSEADHQGCPGLELRCAVCGGGNADWESLCAIVGTSPAASPTALSLRASCEIRRVLLAALGPLSIVKGPTGRTPITGPHPRYREGERRWWS